MIDRCGLCSSSTSVSLRIRGRSRGDCRRLVAVLSRTFETKSSPDVLFEVEEDDDDEHECGHVAPFYVFHHHAEVFACLECAHKRHYEWVVRECHDVTFGEHLCKHNITFITILS